MTLERFYELKKMLEAIAQIDEDLDNLDVNYDRYQLVGRIHGEGLDRADGLLDLDGEMLGMIKEYLKNKRNRLADEFKEA